MILRALAPLVPGPEYEPVWTALDRSQRQDFSAGCWMVPQPAHAATAGDMARQLSPAAFPGITPEVVKAIALHDAGWSPDDAAGIQDSRARGERSQPYSFIAAPTQDVVAAWTGSIEIAGQGSPVGAYLVSRHFSAIAEFTRDQAGAQTAPALVDFVRHEEVRRAKLRKELPQSDAVLACLLAALQFCDLFSLYLSAGLAGSVTFPQEFRGDPIRLAVFADGVRFTPSPFANECSFAVGAIRHPRLPGAATHTFRSTVLP